MKKMIIITKEIKSNGYKAYENYMFKNDSVYGMMASHYINNKKGTYYQRLESVFFETADQGNEFYKKKLAQGFKKM